jgi:hypothetical protein
MGLELVTGLGTDVATGAVPQGYRDIATGAWWPVSGTRVSDWTTD